MLSNNGNVFWGLRSGYSNSKGYSNIALGSGALKSNINGSHLVAIGDSALFNNSIDSRYTFEGSRNVAVGSKSLFLNVFGTYNSAIGFQSLYSNTTGNGNTANGVMALFLNTGGYYNTASGYQSLYSNNGIDNAAYGYQSLYSNTKGYYNTATGNQSLYHNQTAFYNTANGYQSLFYNTTGSYNVAIGYLALNSNLKGNNNSGLGFLANVESSELKNATAIGANSLVACNNCMVLGSVARVNGGTSNVKIGIGTTNPGFPLNFADSLGDKISLWGGAGSHYGFGIQDYLLQIHTDSSFSDIAFGFGSSKNFTENMRISGTGNLQVRGSITANSSFYISDSRYKKAIEPIDAALERIIQLKGYHYYWNDELMDPTLQSGVLAQEVQVLFPELVRTDDKGYLSVNYVGLIPFLIQSIKEQQEQIINKQKQIDQHKNDIERLNTLEREIIELKKIVKGLLGK